jgi:hypothetical protein
MHSHTEHRLTYSHTTGCACSLSPHSSHRKTHPASGVRSARTTKGAVTKRNPNSAVRLHEQLNNPPRAPSNPESPSTKTGPEQPPVGPMGEVQQRTTSSSCLSPGLTLDACWHDVPYSCGKYIHQYPLAICHPLLEGPIQGQQRHAMLHTSSIGRAVSDQVIYSLSRAVSVSHPVSIQARWLTARL